MATHETVDPPPRTSVFGAGTVKIDPETVWKLRIITAHDGVTIAEFIDPILKPAVDAAFDRVSNAMRGMATTASSE